MGEKVKFSWPLYNQELCEGIIKLLKDNFQTDFKMCVKSNESCASQVVKVHHLILAIFCPLLRNTKEKKVMVPIGCSVDDVKCLVEFLYSGKTGVTKERLANVRNGAKQLGMKALVDCIDTYNNKQQLEAKGSNKQPINRSKPSSVSENLDQTKDISEAEDRTDVNAEVSRQNSGLHLRKMSIAKSSKDERPSWSCKFCPYTAKHKYKVVYHMNGKHHTDFDGNKLEKTLSCSQCSFTCYVQFQLKNHVLVKHNHKVKCEQCDYTCTCNAALQRHLLHAHSDERPIMCELCGLCFKTLAAFNVHMERHQEKRTNCSICGVSLSPNSLHHHMKSHSSASLKSYTCHLCNFDTSQRHNLNVHLSCVHNLVVEGQCQLASEDRALSLTHGAIDSEAVFQIL